MSPIFALLTLAAFAAGPAAATPGLGGVLDGAGHGGGSGPNYFQRVHRRVGENLAALGGIVGSLGGCEGGKKCLAPACERWDERRSCKSDVVRGLMAGIGMSTVGCDGGDAMAEEQCEAWEPMEGEPMEDGSGPGVGSGPGYSCVRPVAPTITCMGKAIGDQFCLTTRKCASWGGCALEVDCPVLPAIPTLSLPAAGAGVKPKSGGWRSFWPSWGGDREERSARRKARRDRLRGMFGG